MLADRSAFRRDNKWWKNRTQRVPPAALGWQPKSGKCSCLCDRPKTFHLGQSSVEAWRALNQCVGVKVEKRILGQLRSLKFAAPNDVGLGFHPLSDVFAVSSVRYLKRLAWEKWSLFAHGESTTRAHYEAKLILLPGFASRVPQKKLSCTGFIIRSGKLRNPAEIRCNLCCIGKGKATGDC